MSNTLTVETTRYDTQVATTQLVVEVNPSTTLAAATIGMQAENKEPSSLPAGAIVAMHSSGSGIVRASADDSMLPAVGIIPTSRMASEVGIVQTDGTLELNDWTAIVGTTTLAANASYYLSTTPGQLTTTIPQGAGRLVQAIGKAVTPTTLDISIMNPIRRN